MLMPSSKGWVKFSPFFLSRQELLKSWVSDYQNWKKSLNCQANFQTEAYSSNRENLEILRA